MRLCKMRTRLSGTYIQSVSSLYGFHTTSASLGGATPRSVVRLSNQEIASQECFSRAGWIVDQANESVQKQLNFKDFNGAFAFLTRLAMKAERINHHPEFSNVYNVVNVKLTTHSVNGLSRKDIVLAEFINNIYE